MKNVYQAGLSLAIFLFLSGCGGGSSSTIVDPGDNSGSSTANKPALKAAASAVELETYIRDQMLAIYGAIRPEVYPVYAADATATASVGDRGAAASFSTTNLQEAGVDEADRIKTDGIYLYTTAINEPAINIFRTAQDSATLVNTLTPADNNAAPLDGLYLSGQQLVALSGNHPSYGIWDSWFIPGRWMNRSSDIFLFDASNPASPTQTARLTLDGQLISSRRIGSTLYLATRHTPTLPGLKEYPSTQAEVNTNISLINNASLSDFLPDYQLDSGVSGEIFAAGDCFLTQYADKQHGQASLISLVAVDLNAAAPVPQGKCFAGDTETLYASTEAIYLATTQYNYATSNSGDIATTAFYEPDINTDLHKFSLHGNAIDYRGSGRVDGHLGWQQDLKAFRLSEYDNVLRIITYTGEQPTSIDSPATLYTLQENTASQSLEILARLPNDNRPAALGKPGEQIYATRFAGERGFLVTFRMTDPLYILDLSNPADPFIAGELEIEGYSDYLHPVSETLLLGIGKDAIAAGTSGDGRGAWYQGVKLSLIDITDPANAYEKEKHIIGKRGTETAVSQTHHAFTALNRNGVLQVALPVSLHDQASDTPGVFPVDDVVAVAEDTTPDVLPPSTFYGWTKDALYRLNIDPATATLQMLPEINGSSSADNARWRSPNWPHDRSVMIGDYIHYLHGDKVISQAW